ncbi:MAG: hypothetical protein ACETWR_18125 [Anaerolineae bacterium]
MNVHRFLAFVLLVGLAIASGSSAVHTSAASPPASALSPVPNSVGRPVLPGPSAAEGSQGTSAPAGSWRSSGPYGGHADALALSPDFASDGLALAGGWRMGYGAIKAGQGLFRSNDGGQTWSRVPQGIPDDHDITSLAFSPAFEQDQTAFAGTWRGLFRSRDGGGSWQKLAGGLPLSGPGEMTALALSPAFADDGVMLAGSSAYLKMWRSTDGGDTWGEVLSAGVAAIALSPDFPTDGLAFAGSGDLYRSTDGGLTWTQVPYPTPIFVTSLALSPNLSNDGTLFAGTWDGLLRSTDHGDTWTPVNTGLGDLGINALALSPAYPGDPTLFAGTREGLYRSTDGGQSWNLTSLPAEHVGAVALSPAFADDGVVLAGTRNGVYKSTDRGTTWHLTRGLAVLPIQDVAASPAYPDDGTLFAATEYGVYKSTDRGVSWTPTNRGHTTPLKSEMSHVVLSPDYPQDHTLFTIQIEILRLLRYYLYRSTDDGQTWRWLWTETNFYSSFDMSLAYAQDGTLFMAALNTVLRSTDGGEHWAMYNEGIEGLDVSVVALSPDWAHDQTLFAAGYGPTYRSTDGGASWQPLSSPLPPLYDLALSPNYALDRTLFASYREIEPSAIWPESGVVRSTDGGETWELASTGLPGTYDPWARSIALSPNFATDRTLYVAYQGTSHQGPNQVFRSTDAGETWVPLPPIPGEPQIHALTVTGHDTVHVATDNGVWHYSEPPPDKVFTIAQGALLPAVASLPGSDRFLVVWDMALGIVDGTYLRARFVDSTGQLIGSEFAPTSPGGSQHIPSVTANPAADEFLVTWWDFRESLGDIYGQRLAADGPLIGEEFLIARAANFENWPPAVAYNPVSDEYLVVWYQDRGEPGESNIYGQRVSADGNLVGGVFTINDEGTPQVRPAVMANGATGEYLVVWSLGGPELGGNLYSQRLKGSGEKIGGSLYIGRGDKPAVTYNNVTGEYLVVRADGFAQAARVQPDGSVIGDIAISEPGNSKNFSDVASDSAGSYLAIWEAPGDDILTIVFGRELSPQGELQSIERPLSSPIGRNIIYPAVAYNAQANVYLVVWEEWVEGEPMVRGRIYRPGEFPPQPPAPPVELVNGDFEGGFYLLNGQSIASGWAAYTVWGQPTFAGERSTVHSGQWAYKISGYAPFTAGLAQVVSVQPGRTYRVTAYYQLYPPGDGQALLGVQDGTSAAQWVGGGWPGVWQSLSQEITVTSDRLTIILQGRNGPEPNANVYFDDVTVVVVGSP